MPRHEINWEPEIVPPAEVLFKAAIDEEVGRIESIIENADGSRATLGHTLLILTDSAEAGVYFTKTSALFGVFARHGVLGTYYDCYNRRLTTYQDTDAGWRQRLPLPDGRPGAFEITYETQQRKQTVRYLSKGK